MSSFFGRWVDGVRRYAWLTLAVIAALTAASIHYTVGHFSIDTNPDEMLSPELPYRQKGAELSRLFPHQHDSMVAILDGPNADLVDRAAGELVERIRLRDDLFREVFDARGLPYFRHNGLLFLSEAKLADLLDRLAEAQPLIGRLWANPDLGGLFDVLRLALEQAEDGDAPLEMDFVLGQIAAVVDAQIARQPGYLSWQELLQGRPLEEHERRRIIVTQAVLDYGSIAPAGKNLDWLSDLEQELGLAERYGVRLRVTGSTALETEELRSIQQGMGLATTLSLLLVSGLLALGLRSPKLVLATVATLVVGLVWSLGLALLVVGRLNLVSVAFAVLFVGLSVDFGIHYSLRLREALAAGELPETAFRTAAESVGGSLALCAVAAAIGFFSFIPTDYIGLAELGKIAGMSMFVALVTNLSFLPAVLAISPPRAHRIAERVPGPSRLRGNARAIAGAALLVAVAAVATATQVRFDSDPFSLRDPNSDAVRALFDLAEDKTTTPYRVIELAPDLDAAKHLATELAALPEVDSVLTLASFVPADQDAKLDLLTTSAYFLLPALDGEAPTSDATPAERRQAFDSFRSELARFSDGTAPGALARLGRSLDRLDAERGLGDDVLAELEERLMTTLPARLIDLRNSLQTEGVSFEDIPEELRRRWIAADGQVRLEAVPAAPLYGDQDALTAFALAMREKLPRGAGLPMDVTAAGEAVVSALAQATAISSILVVLLVASILRRRRDTLLVLAPLALAALVTVAGSVLLSVPFNFANVIVLPLVFGLGVASGIHLVLRERDGDGGDVLETSTPRAVAFSALTTIGSFGSLAVVPHPGTASMGILLTVAIVATLIAAIVVLPALMTIFPPARAES